MLLPLLSAPYPQNAKLGHKVFPNYQVGVVETNRYEWTEARRGYRHSSLDGPAPDARWHVDISFVLRPREMVVNGVSARQIRKGKLMSKCLVYIGVSSIAGFSLAQQTIPFGFLEIVDRSQRRSEWDGGTRGGARPRYSGWGEYDKKTYARKLSHQLD